MKRHLIIPVAAFMLASCSGQKKSVDENSANQDIVITDAICLDAKGPVASMEISTKNGLFESVYTYTLNEDGELVSIEDGVHVDLRGDDLKIERDDLKRPVKVTTSYTELGEDEPYEDIVVYGYDDASNLISEKRQDVSDIWTMSYSLNDAGHATGYTISDAEGEQKATIVYPEDAFDAEGNWTSRTVSIDGETFTITRKIDYRK